MSTPMVTPADTIRAARLVARGLAAHAGLDGALIMAHPLLLNGRAIEVRATVPRVLGAIDTDTLIDRLAAAIADARATSETGSARV